MQKEEDCVADMLTGGQIEASDSPWSSPLVLVTKKDGGTRFCVDYRQLNDATIKDAYPLPRIDDTLDMLAGKQWFSTLDLASGYWQVSLSKAARAKTAFATHSGLFHDRRRQHHTRRVQKSWRTPVANRRCRHRTNRTTSIRRVACRRLDFHVRCAWRCPTHQHTTSPDLARKDVPPIDRRRPYSGLTAKQSGGQLGSAISGQWLMSRDGIRTN